MVIFRNDANHERHNNNFISPEKLRPIGLQRLIDGFEEHDGLILAEWLSKQRGFDVLFRV